MEHFYRTSLSTRTLSIYPERGGADRLIDDIACAPHPKLARFIEDLENGVHGLLEDNPVMSEEEAKLIVLAGMVKQAYGIGHFPTLSDMISFGNFDREDEESILQAAEDIRDAREAAVK